MLPLSLVGFGTESLFRGDHRQLLAVSRPPVERLVRGRLSMTSTLSRRNRALIDRFIVSSPRSRKIREFALRGSDGSRFVRR